jgi:two-component system, chemotaxis family, CheB/CheR fusion protein
LIWSYFKIRNENSLRLQAQFDADVLEKLVAERTNEINHINQLLENQNAQLARKNRDLTSFTSIASHDLKEPLRKIQMFSNIVKEDHSADLSENSLQYIDKISDQAGRMKNLIESVLQYAQTDEETLGFRITNLNHVAKAAMETLSEKIKEKNAVVLVHELPTLSVRPDQMEQVFINLLDNGLKYSRPGVRPVLEISATPLEAENAAETQTSCWKLDFRDNGIGFEETYKSKIFEIFQRLHSRHEYPGTGIGLAMCKRIIENHRGTISSHSVPGEGSVFSIILPAK